MRNTGYGTYSVNCLVRLENDCLEHGRVIIDICRDGLMYAATGQDVELAQFRGSVAGWGKFDQDNEHWRLGSSIITEADAREIKAVLAELNKAPAPQGWESVGTDHEDDRVASEDNPREFLTYGEARAYASTLHPGQPAVVVRRHLQDLIDDGTVVVHDYTR